MGVGMIVCGMVTDRLTRVAPDPQVDHGPGLRLAVAGAAAARLRPGPRAAAARADRGRRVLRRRHHRPGRRHGREPDPGLDPRHRLRHLTLANNLLGLAAGPFVVGLLADRIGLDNAMQIVPLVSVLAIVALLIGRRAYPSSIRRAGAVASA